MKIDWKVSAIAAGGAFLLSALVGIIGSVSFGALVLRAILSAVVFGAGAVGVTFLIDRYLPELGAAAQSRASETGNSVDIVVEGEDDLTEAAVLGAEVADGDAGDVSNEEVDTEDGSEELAAVDEDVVDLTDESDDDADDTDGTAGSDGVDGELPSVDSMSDSFTEVPLAEDAVEDGTQSGEDPAVMARAIRTVLNREE